MVSLQKADCFPECCWMCSYAMRGAHPGSSRGIYGVAIMQGWQQQLKARGSGMIHQRGPWEKHLRWVLPCMLSPVLYRFSSRPFTEAYEQCSLILFAAYHG